MLSSIARLLGSDLRSSGRSEPQTFRLTAHPTSDQLKDCPDILSFARSRASRNSLVFPTLTLHGSDKAAARRYNFKRSRGKNTRLRLVFSPTLLSCSIACCVLKTDQRTVEASLLILLINETLKMPYIGKLLCPIQVNTLF